LIATKRNLNTALKWARANHPLHRIRVRKSPNSRQHKARTPIDGQGSDATQTNKSDDATKTDKTVESKVTIEDKGPAPPNPAPLKDDEIKKIK